MVKESVARFLETFSSKNVLVIGDAMLDAYMWGEIERMSPEAPIPVVDILKREKRLGGAANVALNLKSLGINPVLLTLTGKDSKAEEFIDLMRASDLVIDGILQDDNRKTTQKTRIIAKGKHVLRVDEEDVFDFLDTQLVLNCIAQLHQQYQFDVVIFEDYNKGLLSEEIIKGCITFCKNKGIKTIVDPKKKNFFAFKGVDVFKPNLKEITEGLNTTCNPENIEELIDVCTTLKDKLFVDSIFLTLSEHGVFILSDQEHISHPSFNRNIVDVSGAGDTVVSVASLALACGLENKDLALIANLAGGLVCEHVGVVPINKDQLISEIKDLYNL